MAFWFFGVVGLVMMLGGCCGDCNNPPQVSSPSVSKVVEDNSGQKYFASFGFANKALSLYAWDTTTMQWKERLSLNALSGSVESLYLDSVNNTPQSFFLYNSFMKKLTEINMSTLQQTERQFTNNYSIISADEFVVYEGSIVKSHRLSTNVISSLHVLPTLSAVRDGLGLNIDVTKYQMLCTPKVAYRNWDRKTHACTMARDVRYQNVSQPMNNNLNDEYMIFITVDSVGLFSYELYDHIPQSYGETYFGEWQFDDLMVDYPIYTSHYVGGCFGTIDQQGNLHNFCGKNDSPTVFSYSFYDKTNPAVAQYVQALP